MLFPRYALIFTLSFLISSYSISTALADTVPSADGVPISYQVQGEGDVTLVFVHGWSCDQSYWDAQVEYFSKQYAVVTLDLAGHGESGLEREQWTVEAFGADVVAVVTQLELEQVVLIGHSLGGPVVIEAARHLPERVVGVIGIDTLQNVELKANPEQIIRVLTPLREDVAGFTQKIVKSMFTPVSDPALVENIVTDMASAPPDVAINTMGASLEFNLAQASEEVQAPVRCINSDKFPTDLEINRQYITSFEVVVVPGAGHFFFLEEPQTFNDVYLGRVLAELTDLTASEERSE